MSYHSRPCDIPVWGPEAQEEKCRSGLPAAELSPCQWIETSSLGAGISKVQREKGGDWQVCVHGSFWMELQSQHRGFPSVSHVWPRTSPAGHGQDGCDSVGAVWRVGVCLVSSWAGTGASNELL